MLLAKSIKILYTADTKMDINNFNHNNDTAFAERYSSQIKAKHPLELLLKKEGISLIKPGDMTEGIVLEKKGTRIFIDLGPRGTGIIYGREYYGAPEIIKHLKPGDQITAKVVELDNEEGYIELSLKDIGEEQKWLELKKMMQEGEMLELPVLEANRGGLILETKGIKGFLPASQLSSKNYPRVAGGDKEKIYQELQKLVGAVLKVKILDFDPAEQKLIFTEKGQETQDLQRILSKYKNGDEVEGEVTGVVDFGAFVKFDELGLEGLVHISEIGWSLIEDPREALKVGEQVRAKIIDMQGNKVSLSLKQLKEDPWIKIAGKYRKGDIIKGLITKFNPFGAFAEIEREIHGLVHISEFGTETRMREELELNKEYDFKILLLDPKEHRMSLGLISTKLSFVEPEVQL